MGFQWVLAERGQGGARFLIFNSEHAFDLSGVDLLPGDDPDTMLTNGQRVMVALQQPHLPLIGRPEPSRFTLLENRIALLASLSAQPAISTKPHITRPSSLVKRVKLSSSRVFHRYSAFAPDRRVDPATGNFAPGTSVCPSLRCRSFQPGLRQSAGWLSRTHCLRQIITSSKPPRGPSSISAPLHRHLVKQAEASRHSLAMELRTSRRQESSRALSQTNRRSLTGACS